MVPALVLLGGLPLLLVVPRERVLDAFDHTLRLAVAVVAAELGETGELRLRQVEPVDGLGEAQVGVDARDDDAGVDRDELDADDRDPDVGVDDEALVEDQVDDVGEPARAWGALEVVARRSSGCDSHGVCVPVPTLFEPALCGDSPQARRRASSPTSSSTSSSPSRSSSPRTSRPAARAKPRSTPGAFRKWVCPEGPSRW